MIRSRAVYRLVAILLLSLLPLQITSAAVSTLCADERQPASHFAHHEHVALAFSTVAEAAADRESPPSDPAEGCLFCAHSLGHCASAPIVLHALLRPNRVPEQPSSAYAFLLAASPERPKWATAP